MKATRLQQKELREVVALADSGTWGDEGTPKTGAPVLRSTNIDAYRMVFDDPAWRVIPQNDRERRRLATGDIIVTKSSGSPDHIGKCAVFEDPDDGHDYYFSNFMLRLRADGPKLDHRWLFYWLTSARGRFELQRLNSTTTGLRNLNVGLYLSQKIPLPPLSEQKRIADILDKADTIRRNRQEALDTADSYIPAAFHHVFGDPILNPHGFPVKSLGDTCDVRDGTHDSPQYYSSGYPLITSKNVKYGTLDFEDVGLISEEEFNQINKRSRVDRGDIIMPMIGTIGNPAIVETDRPFAIKNVALIKFSDSDICNYYILHLLRGPYFAHCIQTINRGGTQKFIALGDIRGLPIPIPDKARSKEFRTVVTAFNDKRRLLSRAFTEANDLFNSLVQRAFRGEL